MFYILTAGHWKCFWWSCKYGFRGSTFTLYTYLILSHYHVPTKGSSAFRQLQVSSWILTWGWRVYRGAGNSIWKEAFINRTVLNKKWKTGRKSLCSWITTKLHVRYLSKCICMHCLSCFSVLIFISWSEMFWLFFLPKHSAGPVRGILLLFNHNPFTISKMGFRILPEVLWGEWK